MRAAIAAITVLRSWAVFQPLLATMLPLGATTLTLLP
jgi:hypothetical protein